MSSIQAKEVFEVLKKIRAKNPIVHNVTNFVVMQWTANTLLAIGASPIMAHAKEEAGELSALADALVINIGTLDSTWIESMKTALIAYKAKNKSIVLDPVGAGATHLRTQTILDFCENFSPNVIRGNASEILALTGNSRTSGGIDARTSSQDAVKKAQELAVKFKSTTCVSGEIDFIHSLSQEMYSVHFGHPWMTKVTGMGCAASAIIGAAIAVESDSFRATAAAMTITGVCGEIAAQKSNGPGSFQSLYLDALFNLDLPTLQHFYDQRPT